MWQYNYSQPPDELMHYGVKGMRWGVRKDVVVKKNRQKKLEESYISKGLTQEQANKKAKTRINVEKVIIASAAITLVAATAYVARKEYVTNWTETTLNTGTIFKRMAQMPDGDISSKTFVSFLTNDSKHYSKLKYGDAQMYQVSLKAVNKITAPSHRTVTKLWSKAIQDNAELIKNDSNIRQFANTLYSKNPEIKRASIGVIPRNNKLWIDFSNELKNAGYNAVIDYTDAGGGAEKPMILLDAMRDVYNIGSKKM